MAMTKRIAQLSALAEICLKTGFPFQNQLGNFVLQQIATALITQIKLERHVADKTHNRFMDLFPGPPR